MERVDGMRGPELLDKIADKILVYPYRREKKRKKRRKRVPK
jgi:hypothetical protein